MFKSLQTAITSWQNASNLEKYSLFFGRSFRISIMAASHMALVLPNDCNKQNYGRFVKVMFIG